MTQIFIGAEADECDALALSVETFQSFESFLGFSIAGHLAQELRTIDGIKGVGIPIAIFLEL